MDQEKQNQILNDNIYFFNKHKYVNKTKFNFRNLENKIKMKAKKQLFDLVPSILLKNLEEDKFEEINLNSLKFTWNNTSHTAKYKKVCETKPNLCQNKSIIGIENRAYFSKTSCGGSLGKFIFDRRNPLMGLEIDENCTTKTFQSKNKNKSIKNKLTEDMKFIKKNIGQSLNINNNLMNSPVLKYVSPIKLKITDKYPDNQNCENEHDNFELQFLKKKSGSEKRLINFENVENAYNGQNNSNEIVSLKVKSENKIKGIKLNIKFPISLQNVSANLPLSIDIDLTKLNISKFINQNLKNSDAPKNSKKKTKKKISKEKKKKQRKVKLALKNSGQCNYPDNLKGFYERFNEQVDLVNNDYNSSLSIEHLPNSQHDINFEKNVHEVHKRNVMTYQNPTLHYDENENRQKNSKSVKKLNSAQNSCDFIKDHQNSLNQISEQQLALQQNYQVISNWPLSTETACSEKVEEIYVFDGNLFNDEFNNSLSLKTTTAESEIFDFPKLNENVQNFGANSSNSQHQNLEIEKYIDINRLYIPDKTISTNDTNNVIVCASGTSSHIKNDSQDIQSKEEIPNFNQKSTLSNVEIVEINNFNQHIFSFKNSKEPEFLSNQNGTNTEKASNCDNAQNGMDVLLNSVNETYNSEQEDDILDLHCSPTLFSDIDVLDNKTLEEDASLNKILLNSKNSEEYVNHDIFGIPRQRNFRDFKKIDNMNGKSFMPEINKDINSKIESKRLAVNVENDPRPILPCWPNNPTNIARPPQKYKDILSPEKNKVQLTFGHKINPSIANIFGKPCLEFLKNKCRNVLKCRFRHNLLESKEVKHRILLLSEQHIFLSYQFIKRHQKLYHNYFLIFCEIFVAKNQFDMLIQMSKDSVSYSQSLFYLRAIIKYMMDFGKTKNEVLSIIKETLQEIPKFDDIIIDLVTDVDVVLHNLKTLRLYLNSSYKFPSKILYKLAKNYLQNPDDQLREVIIDILLNIAAHSPSELSGEKNENLKMFLKQRQN